MFIRPIIFPFSVFAPGSRRRGVSLVYVSVSILVLLGFCSLAVDLARVQAAKTELEVACDAAARSASANLSNGVSSAQAAAFNMAAANSADGKPVAIDSINNVVFLNWPNTTPLTGSARSSANAIKVSAVYQIPLLFAQALGVPTATIHASSTAKAVTNSPAYRILSLGEINFNNTDVTDSWNSSLGSYASQSHGTQGSIAADSYITLNSNSKINGSVYYHGPTPTIQGGSSYTGSEVSLSSAVTAATPTTPVGASALGGIGLNSGDTMTITAGTYSCTAITIDNTASLNIDASGGPVILYLSGSLIANQGCAINVTGNIPANFQIYITNGSEIILDDSVSLYAVIDMPLGDFTLNGGNSLYGSLTAGSITLETGSAIHYDTALGTNGAGSATTTISQVQ